jgi:hypothetical protein
MKKHRAIVLLLIFSATAFSSAVLAQCDTQKSRLAAGSLLNVLNGFGLANCQLLTASIDTSPVDPAPD